MKRFFRRSALALSVAGAIFWATAAAAQPPAKVGAEGLFDLITSNRDKVVFINFFASWCAPCLFEIPDLKKLRLTVPESDLFLVGISIDESEKDLSKLIAKTGFNYPVYQTTPETAQLFQVTGVPRLIVYVKGALVESFDGKAEFSELLALVEEMKKR